MVDLKRFHRLYPDKLCWVEKVGEDGGIVVLFKRFDNENGRELSPEPHFMTLNDLIKERETLETQLQAVNIILSDASKL